MGKAFAMKITKIRFFILLLIAFIPGLIRTQVWHWSGYSRSEVSAAVFDTLVSAFLLAVVLLLAWSSVREIGKQRATVPLVKTKLPPIWIWPVWWTVMAMNAGFASLRTPTGRGSQLFTWLARLLFVPMLVTAIVAWRTLFKVTRSVAPSK